jgi:uncharacterized membrane protein YgcG
MAGHKTDVIEEASLPSFQEYQYAGGVASDVQGFSKYHRQEVKCKKKTTLLPKLACLDGL